MTDTNRSYGGPAAFRRALTDKLKTMAESSRWTLPQLQRQMAYDRLLERLYLVDDGWIVKGATALLARDIGVRGTIDVDVYRKAVREAAERDLRDVRLPVTASIGTTVWASFRVDLVGTDLHMTGNPEDVPPLARVVMPDVEQHGYRAYPLVDHVADKVCPMFERHGTTEAPSTRYKDLVDLVAIALAASVDAEPQMAALRSEVERRGLRLPARFTVPDRELWRRGYAAEAERSLLAGGAHARRGTCRRRTLS
jgi:hypothetical protein